MTFEIFGNETERKWLKKMQNGTLWNGTSIYATPGQNIVARMAHIPIPAILTSFLFDSDFELTSSLNPTLVMTQPKNSFIFE